MPGVHLTAKHARSVDVASGAGERRDVPGEPRELSAEPHEPNAELDERFAEVRGTFTDLERDLGSLTVLGRRRSLRANGGLDFASNDYLGFARSVELREAAMDAVNRGVPVGAGGSRLLRGNDPEHGLLEECAAKFFGAESTLYFGSGYSANLCLFATAPQRVDLVVHDEFVHASVHDGLRRGRAEVVRARHNDAQDIDDAIVRWRAGGGSGRPWIAVESLYSMDGDGPDLQELYALAVRREAVLVLDEAHATGVLGSQGRGRAAFLERRENVVTVHTCGKALGTAGALVCGPSVLKNFLVNRGRAFIYSTAPSPLVAAVTRAAIGLCGRSDGRRGQLSQLIECATGAMWRRLGLKSTESHVMPIMVGEDGAADRLAAKLRGRGFDVRAIRPPTVPHGTARLRIALTLNVDAAAIENLFEALAMEMK
jgi:8-amino-7-oxononanoate synthase